MVRTGFETASSLARGWLKLGSKLDEVELEVELEPSWVKAGSKPWFQPGSKLARSLGHIRHHRQTVDGPTDSTALLTIASLVGILLEFYRVFALDDQHR